MMSPRKGEPLSSGADGHVRQAPILRIQKKPDPNAASSLQCCSNPDFSHFFADIFAPPPAWQTGHILESFDFRRLKLADRLSISGDHE